MFYSLGVRLVKIQSQFLFRERVVYVILGFLGVIFMVQWLVMIKQWCYILCVAPMKKIMNWINLINLKVGKFTAMVILYFDLQPQFNI